MLIRSLYQLSLNHFMQLVCSSSAFWVSVQYPILAAEIDLFIPLKYLIQCYELHLSHFTVFFSIPGIIIQSMIDGLTQKYQ